MVAIKGLEMPKSCSECPLFHFYLDTNGTIHFICKYGNLEILMVDEKRSDICPLVESEDKKMKLVIDIPDSTIIDLKRKQNRTEVDNAVLNGTPLLQVLDELKAMRNYYTDSSNNY